MTQEYGRAMRRAAVTEAMRAAEARWFARAARHELVYALSHGAAALLAVYVLLTATPAASWHARRFTRAAWQGGSDA